MLTVTGQATREWYRPNPPLTRVNWSIRNNINLQQSAILLAMNYASNNKERFLNNFYLKSKRSVAKARTEGPAAWVLPGDDSRPNEAADLVNLLRMQGCEVHKADREIETKEGKFPAGGKNHRCLIFRGSIAYKGRASPPGTSGHGSNQEPMRSQQEADKEPTRSRQGADKEID